MALTTITLLALLYPCLATPWHQLSGYTFEKYETEFGRSYSKGEREQRRPVFIARLASIASHNANPSVSYKRGVNHLTDRFPHELAAAKGLDRALLYNSPRSSLDQLDTISLDDLPESVDWRKQNVVTPVKNQGVCGSCWTFASAETLESHWAIQTGKLEELSEQFILDCTPNPHQCGGTGGCGGGTAELAYERLAAIGGIPSEWTYPYISGLDTRNQTCHGLPLQPQHPHSGNVIMTLADSNMTQLTRS
eukprot:TRINITY_DN13246_c0_g1_i3.p1 TRINITY_DN13246_c0_g1~~TRINITY_DN13246_c0_g1_i3.p1  ORF type:complete len:250 (-),score=36.27 TRINITY_DN13246_c0_g1_i3:118-867(-)